MSNNAEYIDFFSDIINRLNDNTISEDKKQMIDEFRLKYSVEQDNTLLNNDKKYSDSDFIKFIIMGWYVYKLLNTCEIQEEI